jgi:flagellin
MSIKLLTNIGSQASLHQMTKNTKSTERTMKQLSSGDRIFEAAVDPSGLAITEVMRAKDKSLGQTMRNISEGISLFHTAEGSLGEISNLAIRMRELAMQSANDSFDSTSRSLINREFQDLRKEVDRISSTAQYNGRQLLDGSGINYEFQVGFRGGEQNRITFDSSKLKTNSSSLGISGATIDSKTSAQNTLGRIDGMIEKLSNKRALLGSMGSRLETSNANAHTAQVNNAEAKSRIRDTDFAKATAERARLDIVSSANVAAQGLHNMNPKKVERLL